MNCFKPTIKTRVEPIRRCNRSSTRETQALGILKVLPASRRSGALDAASATGNLNAVEAQQLVFFAGGRYNFKDHIVELSVASIK